MRVSSQNSRLGQSAVRSVLSIWPSVLLPPIRGEAGWGALVRERHGHPCSLLRPRDAMNAQRRQGGGSVSESARQSGMVTDGGPVNEMGMQRQRAKKCGSHRRMRSNHTARTHFTLPGGWGSWGGWGGASRAGDAQSFLVFALLALTACKPTVTTPLDHRPSNPACSLGAPLGSLTTGGSCDATADCTPAPHVACIPYEEAGASFCNYDACEVDTDCPDGGICICATATDGTTVPTTPNTCLAAGNCRIDADCPTVPYCSPSFNRLLHDGGVLLPHPERRLWKRRRLPNGRFLPVRPGRC